MGWSWKTFISGYWAKHFTSLWDTVKAEFLRSDQKVLAMYYEKQRHSLKKMEETLYIGQ